MPDLAWPGAADLIPQATQPAQFADMDPQILQKNHQFYSGVSTGDPYLTSFGAIRTPTATQISSALNLDPTTPIVSRDINGELRTLADAGADELVDTDGDGIPDFYELRYGGSATGLVPTADSDGDSLNNLGELLGSQAKLAEAEAFYRDALAIYRRLHKGDNRDVARSLHNLGYTLRARGKLAEAEPYLRDAGFAPVSDGLQLRVARPRT